MSDSERIEQIRQQQEPNGESLATVVFHFDPAKGVHVERKNGMPRHKLIYALELIKSASLTEPLGPSSSEKAELRLTYRQGADYIEIQQVGSFPPDMLVMAVEMEKQAVVNQTIAQCMMQDAMSQQRRVLMADGTQPPPGLIH